MDSEFTEFSYGFAVTHELVLQGSGNIFAAPEFPSLIREGQVGGGYDVKLDFGTFLFLQFKLSEFMRGVQSGQSEIIGLPYYRFWITPRWRSKQQEMLVDLQKTGQRVYYAAPIFHQQAVFNAEFQGRTVVNRSAFVRPTDIGYLADDDAHCVVFNNVDPQGYFCSKPKEVWLHRGVILRELLANRVQPVHPTRTLELATTLQKLVGSIADRAPSFPAGSVPQALTYISFVAHVFLHSEVFFVPTATEGSSGVTTTG